MLCFTHCAVLWYVMLRRAYCTVLYVVGTVLKRRGIVLRLVEQCYFQGDEWRTKQSRLFGFAFLPSQLSPLGVACSINRLYQRAHSPTSALNLPEGESYALVWAVAPARVKYNVQHGFWALAQPRTIVEA